MVDPPARSSEVSMTSADKARLKRLFDCFKMTPLMWDALDAYQNSLCWICQKPVEGRRLATDHSWDSGEVRGLLCHRCNTILGKIEKPSRSGQPWTIMELRRAIEYKVNPPARIVFGGPHYGWPGDVTTKKHRKMIKKLKRNNETNQTHL